MLIMDKYNFSITINQGEDGSFTYHKDGYPTINNLDFYFTVKPLNSNTTDDSDAVYQLNPENVIFIDYDEEHPQSIAIIKVADSEILLNPDIYKYDLKEVNGDTEIVRLNSNYIVKQSITKRV